MKVPHDAWACWRMLLLDTSTESSSCFLISNHCPCCRVLTPLAQAMTSVINNVLRISAVEGGGQVLRVGPASVSGARCAMVTMARCARHMHAESGMAACALSPTRVIPLMSSAAIA